MATNDSTSYVIGILMTHDYMTVISEEDADLAAFKWYPDAGPHTVYANGHMNATTKQGQRTFQLHRVIMSRVLGRELLPTEYVDHINSDGLDNRRENLRMATRHENQRNQRLRRVNTSGYKGVSWHKASKKWRAIIQVDGKQKALGYYHDPAEAHKAYCEAAVKYYGEFARFK